MMLNDALVNACIYLFFILLTFNILQPIDYILYAKYNKIVRYSFHQRINQFFP